MPEPTNTESALRLAIRNAMECDDVEHLKDESGEACFECQVDKVVAAVAQHTADAVAAAIAEVRIKEIDTIMTRVNPRCQTCLDNEQELIKHMDAAIQARNTQ